MDRPGLSNRSRELIVEIDFGTAYEFLLTLSTLSNDEDMEYEVGNEYFDTMRAKASPHLLKAIEFFNLSPDQAEVCGWSGLLGLAYDCPFPKDVSSLIRYVEAIEPLEICLHLLGYYQRSSRKRTPLDVILQAAEGDPESQRQFLKTSFSSDSIMQEKWRNFFSLDPETTKTRLLDVLRGLYDQIFYDQEQQVLPILERDAETKQGLKQTMTPERLIETATNGLEYVPMPGLRKVLLVPSFIKRPWNETSQYQDMKIFCYPVADESVLKDSDIPPVRLVRLYKALADERRLRILKMLMTRSYSLQELADEFGIAKSTMHHHLAILRASGLVRARDDKVYSLRQNTLSEVSKLLDMYLKGPSL